MARWKRKTPPDNREPPPKGCVWCRGTGYVYVLSRGDPVKWEEGQQPGQVVRRCTHGAPIQGRIEYRDFSEPTGGED